MIETQTSREERLLSENPRLKAACDAIGAKAGHGPCCTPADILKIIEAVDAYDLRAKVVRDDSGWWCPACKCVAPPTEVSFSEHHEVCGHPVE